MSLDREAEVGEHGEVGGGGLAAGGEVVADEDRIGGIETEGLQGAEVMLAATGDADLLGGVDEAHEGEDLEAVRGGEGAQGGEGGAGDRVEEVDGDGVGVDGTEGKGGVDDIVVGLAHAEDGAGAGGEASLFDAFDGAQAIGVGVGGDDVGGVDGARIEVVIVAIDTGLLEDVGLAVLEEAEAAAHLEVGVPVLDGAHGVGDGGELTGGGATATGHDAIGGGVQVGRAVGPLEDRRAGLDGVFGDGGGREARLGAVVAILGAEAALGVEEKVQVHGGAVMMVADAIGGGEQREDLMIGGAHEGVGVLPRGRVAGEDALSQGVPACVHPPVVPPCRCLHAISLPYPSSG